MVGVESSTWTCWVRELRITWVMLLLLIILPCVLFGTGIFSILTLMGAALLGVPTAMLAQIIYNDKNRRARMLRRVAILIAVPLLSLLTIFQTDKLSPQMASPIAKAIESYRQDTGAYPASIEAIIPKYLPYLPLVRVAVFQPEVIYRINNGDPYLAVPSSAGDAFSVYEYNFEEKIWLHN